MWDVEVGCEPVATQLKRWTDALMAGRVDELEDVLAPEFQFTCEARFAGGRMDKTRFIELDRKIKSCSITFLGVTIRKLDTIVTSLAFAELQEVFEGDLGPDMPSAQDMAAMMDGARMAYASAWRQNDAGVWQCTSHHIFGNI